MRQRRYLASKVESEPADAGHSGYDNRLLELEPANAGHSEREVTSCVEGGILRRRRDMTTGFVESEPADSGHSEREVTSCGEGRILHRRKDMTTGFLELEPAAELTA